MRDHAVEHVGGGIVGIEMRRIDIARYQRSWMSRSPSRRESCALPHGDLVEGDVLDGGVFGGFSRPLMLNSST
jgi:hypothetical protein